MKKEIWKIIKDNDGYSVSNLGRVKSNDRLVKHYSGHNAKKIGRERKLFLGKNGYLYVSLYKNGKGVNCLVHRLVAISFIENHGNKKDINHIDGNKLNNYVENLEWSTRKENMKHAVKIGLCKSGENSPLSKLSSEDIINIRSSKDLQKNIAKKYNICSSYVSMIVNNKKRNHDYTNLKAASNEIN